MDLAKATAAFPLLPDSESFRFLLKSSVGKLFFAEKVNSGTAIKFGQNKRKKCSYFIFAGKFYTVSKFLPFYELVTLLFCT